MAGRFDSSYAQELTGQDSGAAVEEEDDWKKLLHFVNLKRWLWEIGKSFSGLSVFVFTLAIWVFCCLDKLARALSSWRKDLLNLETKMKKGELIFC